MKIYEVQAPNGKVYEIEGESMPSGAQLDVIFKKMAEKDKTGAASARLGLPNLDTVGRIGDRIVSNVGNMVKGGAKFGLDSVIAAAQGPLKSAEFAGNTIKGMYDGAVQYGADAIARQMPNGAEDSDTSMVQRLRSGVAAVPVIGSYVMNRASDVEEGLGPEAFADVLTDGVSMMIPGTGAGRAGTAATLSGAAKAAGAVARGAGKAAAKVGPEVAGAVAGAAVSGGVGGVVGGALAHNAKGAVIDWVKKRFGIGAKHAEQIAAKMHPAQVERIVKETIPATAIPDQAMIPVGGIRPSPMTTSAGDIRPIPPGKLPPVLPDPVVPELSVAKSANGDMWNVRTGKRIEMTPEQAKAAVAEQPWNKAKAKAEEALKPKPTLQPGLVERIEKAVSPDAAWKDLQKHGAGDGKRIPKDAAREMVDRVWSQKDPSYTSIEQWMADRRDRWESMRTSSKKSKKE